MKRLFRFLLSRTFFFVILLLTQFFIFFALIWTLGKYSPYAYVVLIALSLIVALILAERDNLNPAYRLMWIVFSILFPVACGIVYLLLGRRDISRRKSKRFLEVEQSFSLTASETPELYRKLSEEAPTLGRSAKYLAKNADAPLYNCTESKFFKDGLSFYTPFISALKAAQKSIFMEYFIIDDDGEFWPEILRILEEKAAAGVDVRLIYDSFGCIITLPADFAEKMRKKNIKCQPFNPIRPSLHITDYTFLNNRDHRKICVIDNETGFTGGLNLADEYINRKKRFGFWKDSALMIKGPAVYSLTVTFLKMWAYVSGEEPDYAAFKPSVICRECSQSFVQPYADSPLDNENVSEFAYFNVLSGAEKYVYITTPYLIIDNEMITNLQLAAKSGVDVRIIVPGIPDKKLVFKVTQSYYKVLIDAGVKIYEYKPGFIHSKMYVSDDKVAIIGSANMDYRSLYLHFENCCAFYNSDIIKDVKADMLDTIEQCREITRDNLKSNFFKSLLQMLLRLFAPML